MRKTNYEYIPEAEGEAPLHIILLAGLYAVLFGAAMIWPWMTLSSFFSVLSVCTGLTAERGAQLIYLISVIVLAVVALILMCVLWRKLEKDFSHKRAIRLTLTRILIALSVGLCAAGGQVLLLRFAA